LLGRLFFALFLLALILLILLSQVIVLALYLRNNTGDGRHVTSNDAARDVGKVLSHTSELVDDVTNRSKQASLFVAANIGLAAQRHNNSDDVVMGVLDLLVSLIGERLGVFGPLIDDGDQSGDLRGDGGNARCSDLRSYGCLGWGLGDDRLAVILTGGLGLLGGRLRLLVLCSGLSRLLSGCCCSVLYRHLRSGSLSRWDTSGGAFNGWLLLSCGIWQRVVGLGGYTRNSIRCCCRHNGQLHVRGGVLANRFL
jgi:hypothetical protein